MSSLRQRPSPTSPLGWQTYLRSSSRPPSATQPERDAARGSTPTHQETPEQRRARVARDIAAEVEAGPGGDRVWAASLAVAWHESAYAPDVDLGPCYRARETGRCDGGRAKCILQIQGYPEVEGDRRACVRIGLRAIFGSLSRCRANPEPERLAGLSGSCDRGRRGAAARWRTALSVYRHAKELAAARETR